jgi:hypothetical protein
VSDDVGWVELVSCCFIQSGLLLFMSLLAVLLRCYQTTKRSTILHFSMP